MRIPKYWKKVTQSSVSPRGDMWLLSAWGWSDESEGAAAEIARERLRTQAEIAAADRPFLRYAYQETDRPIREQVLDRPCAGSVITRNAYGARILNTERIAFVDIDFELQTSKPGFFARLFGAGPGQSREQVIDMKVELLRSALRPERTCARVYQTHSGLRLLLTDRSYDPASEETLALLKSLGCDPLYLSLCRQQECFRARLTPKPWRCDQPTPPGRWPYDDSTVEQAAQAWVDRYEAACASFATTRYVTTLGGRDVHADVRPVLELHDRLTGADLRLSLA